MDYQATLARWHDFYSVTGMSAATLVGLLFVGLSLHLRLVVTRSDVRALARATLTSLTFALVLSLFMVIPENQPSGTGFELVGLGAVGCVLLLPSLVMAFRSREHTLGFRLLLLRFGSITGAFAGVGVLGGLLLGGSYTTVLGWLVGAAVVLLVLSLRNTWDLLVTVGAVALGTADSDH